MPTATPRTALARGAFVLAVLLPAVPAHPANRVPGDLMYYKNNAGGPSPMSLMTAPLPTYNFTVIGPLPRNIFAMDFDNSATELWGIDDATRELGTINLSTGAFTTVGVLSPPLPGTTFVVGMSFDPTSSAIYISTQDSGGAAALYTLDALTLTLVGSLNPGIVAIAIDNGGQMYGHNILTQTLQRIDKTTGATTTIGQTGLNADIAPQGMDFDHSDGTLYGCVVVANPQQGHLVSFDTATGQATILATADHAAECAVAVPAAPTTSQTPIALAVDTAGNGVLQPNEPAVTVAPTWRNNGAAVALTGIADTFTGPGAATYTVDDGTADYGAAGPGALVSCAATGDCYAVTASATSRPATHWDSSILETLAPGGVSKTWILHVGDSFTDVPASNGFYRFIETILHNDVTSGCTPTEYCPTASTTREAMAAFVLVASDPGAGPPPPCDAGAEIFGDVPASSGFCRWIEELFRRGVVTGCTGNLYCPTAAATREQMAVFVLRTLDPSLVPPPCVAGTERFDDVPAGSGFCPWIEELADRGVVTGCTPTSYCPNAEVTREQMAVFLAVTFGLVLYGV